MKIRIEGTITVDVDLPHDLAGLLVVEDGQVNGPEGNDMIARLSLGVSFVLAHLTDRLHPELVSSDYILWSPICRECGCTEDEACPTGCTWVETDLCSTHAAAT